VNGTVKNTPKRTLFWRRYDTQEHIARQGNGPFKVLLKTNKKELYNVNEDISETRNLFEENQHKTVREFLVKELEEWKMKLKEPAFLGLVKEQMDEYWKQRNKRTP